MKYPFLIFLSLFLCTASLSGQTLAQLLQKYNRHSVPYISVGALRMEQSKIQIILLDAREAPEFATSHLESAEYVGFNDFSDKEFLMNFPDKNIPIVVYCSLGIRSETVAEKLKKAGYSHVRNLYGGIFEWKNKGYPVVDSTGMETENVHAYSRQWSKWLKSGNPVF